jgi:hypothetical protein
VLEIALDRAPSRSTDTSRSLHDMPAVGSVHPALCAAIANVARARILSARAHTAVVDAQVLRTARRDVIEETQRSRAALRAAIADFAKQLRAGAVAEEEAVLQVQDAVADCASIMGARSDVAALLEDSEVWVRAAYRAA